MEGKVLDLSCVSPERLRMKYVAEDGKIVEREKLWRKKIVDDGKIVENKIVQNGKIIKTKNCGREKLWKTKLRRRKIVEEKIFAGIKKRNIFLIK